MHAALLKKRRCAHATQPAGHPPLPRHPTAAGHLPLYALNKLPYGKLAGAKIGVKEGVMFLTYSSLTSSSGAPPPATARCSPTVHGHKLHSAKYAALVNQKLHVEQREGGGGGMC